jgi:glycosyltransferase involved in cell wall biosynthesis
MSKVLFIATNEWDWGGSEILWSQTAERLARAGDSVVVSIQGLGKPREPLDRIKAAGGDVHFRANKRSLPAALIGKIIRPPSLVEEHVRKLAKGVDLAVVCYSSFLEVLPWLDAVRSLGLKYTIIVQGANTSFWPDDSVAERLAAGFEGAVRPFFVSQATMDLCRRQFGAPMEHGCVIRNPFNVRYDAHIAWPEQSDDQLKLASVGRLELGTKGQDILLEVLSLPHWRERKMKLSLVGSGPQERTLQRRAKELGLTNVQFAGHQSNVEEVWKKHHALVLPSRQEGMPLVVVEAMLCGRPCIATDVGGNRELMREGVNGFLAEASTPGAFDAAMNRAWENRSGLREMGQCAARDVRRWVSADPVGDFAVQLKTLASETNGAGA